MRSRDRFSGNAEVASPPLSAEELTALKKACGPIGVLSFPPATIIRSLRQHGYIEIVLGGVQATPRGLERLLRERQLRAHS